VPLYNAFKAIGSKKPAEPVVLLDGLVINPMVSSSTLNFSGSVQSPGDQQAAAPADLNGGLRPFHFCYCF
jgi:hypothetical protein